MKADEEPRHSAQRIANEEVHVTTRAEISEHIRACLEGKLSNAALAKWAFDRFYAEEIGAEDFEDDAEPIIAEVLDTLMFGDDPDFHLDEAELHDLLAQLRKS